MSNILSGIYAGLNSTHAYLAGQYENGLTLENLNAARNDAKINANLNQSFANYLQSNFADLDADGDGIISATEMTDRTNQLSTTGLTKAELQQLYASGQSGISESKMTEILEHFEDMDTNGDGRLTDAEITAFTVNSAKQERMDEDRLRSAGNMSLFYGDDSSSDSTYSILSYQYKKSKS